MTKVSIKKASLFDALNYYVLAYRAYVAARTLLLRAHYLPAATLADTCLEKYIKCILATRGIKVNVVTRLRPARRRTPKPSLQPDLLRLAAPAFADG